ncbi:hypothetical protein POVCU2_0078530, partial [Plasmodium ovale curtisi]
MAKRIILNKKTTNVYAA